MILEAIEKYIEAIEKTKEWGNMVGQMLVDTLRPIIWDIVYSVGWAEAGISVICFWSEEYRGTKGKSLAEVIGEVFPELIWHVDCPFEMWLPPDVAERVRKALEELRERG